MRLRKKKDSELKRLLLGATAGVAATFVMQAMLQASKKLMPESMPPMKKDAGEFMVEQLESLLPEETRRQIPEQAEKAAASSLHLGYGLTSGLLYAALRPKTESALLEGTLLGVGVWAAGYLGWIPAVHLAPPVTELSAKQIAVPVVEHALFGIATVSALDGLMRI